MSKHHASAKWNGSVPTGTGTMTLGLNGPAIGFNLKARVEEEQGTNPEQMLGAALAGCFSMSLANMIEESGQDMANVDIESSAVVHLVGKEDGFWITQVDLTVSGHVPGMAVADLETMAEKAKDTCPVSKLYSSATITLSTDFG
jgi:osmotically inducible protein OsmC